MLISGYINFYTVVLYPRNLEASNLFLAGLTFTGALIILGEVIYALNTLHLSIKAQETILFCVFILFDCILYMRFAYAGHITFWAVVMLFLFATVVFNNFRLMTAGAVFHIILQIYYAVRYPVMQVQVDYIDHVSRIFLTVAGIFLANYVNRTYLQRLHQNEEQARFLETTSKISMDLVANDSQNSQQTVHKVLRHMGQYLNHSCLLYIEMGFEGELLSSRHCDKSGEVYLPPMHAEAVQTLLQLPEISGRQDKFCIPVEQLAAQAPMAYAFFKQKGFRTLLYVPLSKSSEKMELLLISDYDQNEETHQRDYEFIEIATNALTNYFTRLGAQRELNYLAFNDPLTGLFKREKLVMLGDEMLDSQTLEDRIPAALFVDIDTFKEINETAGRRMGDEALKIVAGRLREQCGENDILSRLGGDEFVLMTVQNDVAAVQAKAEALLQAVLPPVVLANNSFYMTASVGVALYPWDGITMEALITNADFAMYEAKESGKNRIVFYSNEKKNMASYATAIKNSLREALEQNQFELNYQPQMDLESLAIVGIEALLRWPHPRLGIIPPSVFIPIAEQQGFISQLDSWVLGSASRQCSQWVAQGIFDRRVAVNFSFSQFRNEDIAAQVSQVLQDSNLAPQHLEIEITESVIGRHSEEIVKKVVDLKKMGVTIAIDDFGSDYSNLGRLHHLPFDSIKIDRDFVSGLFSPGKRGSIIIENVIQLALELNVPLVAEGVETQAQARFLQEHGCARAQGYYFYKPMSAQDMQKVLQQHAHAAAQTGASPAFPQAWHPQTHG